MNKNLYSPDGNDTARYTIKNLTPFVVQIGSTVAAPIDRSEGEYFPGVEGEGFIVTRCDFPVMCELIAGGNSVRQRLNPLYLAPGLRVNTPFRGFTLFHPPLTTNGTDYQHNLELLVFRKGDAFAQNQVEFPCSGFKSPFRNNTSTGVSFDQRYYIPPGARVLREFQATFGTTTVQTAALGFYDASGTLIRCSAGITQQVGAVNVAYADAGAAWRGLNVINVGSAILSYVRESNVVVPTNAVELSFAVTGTGIVAPLQYDTVWQ